MKRKINSILLPHYYLLGIGAGLLLIHLTLVYKVGNVNLLGISLLGWAAVASLVWENRDRLTLNSSIIPFIFGLTFIALVLIRSATLPSYNFLCVSPFLSGIGLSLLASGFLGFKQFGRELMILFFLGVPKALLLPIVDLSIFTSKATTAMMWYVGFDVKRFGTKIAVFDQAIVVNKGCDGSDTMLDLLILALLFLSIFPVKGWKNLFVPMIAVITAFIVNCVRVSVMAILVKQKDAFEYWHTGEGSLIFSLIAVAIFGGFCYLVLQQENGISKIPPR